jgi:putative ABC transport system permease protein
VVDQLRSLGLVVALMLGVGAVFGMNTMYSAVARRKREIGVLRVLGFSRSGNILGSFVIESAILGVAGGIAGIMLAFLAA